MLEPDATAGRGKTLSWPDRAQNRKGGSWTVGTLTLSPGTSPVRPDQAKPRRVMSGRRTAVGMTVTPEQVAHRAGLTELDAAARAVIEEAIADAYGEVAAYLDYAPTPPTFTERLDNRIAMEKAQLAALEAVQPSAKAFFDSLTAEQQAQLTPQRGEPGFGPHGRPGQHGGPNGKGQHGRPGQMGAPDQPATPAEAPTEALPQT